MSTVATVPVMITPAARSFIDGHTQSEQFDRMLEWARQMVPGLTSIEIVLDDGTDEMPPAVVIWTHRDHIAPGDDPTLRNWIDWLAATFPAEICENFTLLSIYHDHVR
jgi:hypothetical protein